MSRRTIQRKIKKKKKKKKSEKKVSTHRAHKERMRFREAREGVAVNNTFQKVYKKIVIDDCAEGKK